MKELDSSLIFKELLLLMGLCFVPLQAVSYEPMEQYIYVFTFFMALMVQYPNTLLFPYITGLSVLSAVLIAIPSMTFFYLEQKKMISHPRFEAAIAIILSFAISMLTPISWVNPIEYTYGGVVSLVMQLPALVVFVFVILPISLRPIYKKIEVMLKTMDDFEDMERFERQAGNVIVLTIVLMIITFFAPFVIILQQFAAIDSMLTATIMSPFMFFSMSQYFFSYMVLGSFPMIIVQLIAIFHILFAKRVIQYLCNETDRAAVIRMGVLSMAWSVFMPSLLMILSMSANAFFSLILPLPILFVYGTIILRFRLPATDEVADSLITPMLEQEPAEERFVIVPIHYRIISILKIKLGKAKSILADTI